MSETFTAIARKSSRGSPPRARRRREARHDSRGRAAKRSRPAAARTSAWRRLHLPAPPPAPAPFRQNRTVPSKRRGPPREGHVGERRVFIQRSLRRLDPGPVQHEQLALVLAPPCGIKGVTDNPLSTNNWTMSWSCVRSDTNKHLTRPLTSKCCNKSAVLGVVQINK